MVVRAIVAAALAGIFGSACGESKSGKGLPPAQDWKAPTASGSTVGEGEGSAWRGQGSDPHAGMDMGGAGGVDPHAGMDMGGAGGVDPHAGMDMGGAGGVDPHAGMDMGGAGGGDPHAGVDMGGGDPMMELEPPDPNRAIDESKFLAGQVIVDAKVGAVTLPVVLFVSVRPIAEATGDIIGQPLAVERLDVTEFPVAFRLTEAQSMVANTVFEGAVEVYARVDGDGEARTVEPGDIEGSVRAMIPADGLKLRLSSRLR